MCHLMIQLQRNWAFINQQKDADMLMYVVYVVFHSEVKVTARKELLADVLQLFWKTQVAYFSCLE